MKRNTKKQLQSIIESRYARFEAATPKSVEEELESFKTVEDLERATARLQKLQSSSFNQTLQTFIDAEAERHAAELEAKRQQEESEQQRQIEAETAARIEAEKEEERKRKETHRAALKKQAEEAKAAARKVEVARRQALAKERAAKKKLNGYEKNR